MLSNSMERLIMSQTIESPSTATEKKDIQLTKNMKVCFIPNNTNQSNTATLLSRSGKCKEKCSKAWNSQLPDRSVKSVDFERDVTMLEKISGRIATERLAKTHLRNTLTTHIS